MNNTPRIASLVLLASKQLTASRDETGEKSGLGHHREFLPLQHGFDEFFGLPYSNDMWPLHPEYVDLPADSEKRKRGFPDLPLLEGNNIIKPKVTGADQAQLTTQYTEKAVEFIHQHKHEPFFFFGGSQ